MSIVTINAGPGSGKTFTLNNGFRTLTSYVIGRIEPTDEQQQVFDYISTEFKDCKRFCFFAHNNSTKDNLIKRLPAKTKVQTFHGAGSSAIINRHRFQKMNQARSEYLIADITGQLVRDMPQAEKWAWLAIKRLVHYLKLEYMTPSQENLEYILSKYPDMSVYPMPADWHDRATKLLEKCAILNGSVEFVDMLWLGVKSVRQPLYDLGFVDESQDISRCAYELVTRLCKNVVFCGDKNQAINAFAGASEEMYDNIANLSDAILPLKMTLRCPPFICEMANAIRPGGIIQGPNTENGEHATIDYNSLPEKLLQQCTPRQTLIVSRTNAAIISCALYLHRQKVPCRIVDKDLADEVKFFFNSFYTKDLRKLREKIDAFEQKGARSKNAMWAQMCVDKATYARELLDAVKSYGELLGLIKETFETHVDGYPLSSIHKAKGLEARSVFVLNPPIELSMAMNHPIAKEQEINLHFVALTRSSKNLYWVIKKC